jgi:GxxExxY protein
MGPRIELDRLAREAADCGFHIHREFGPGLLESAYETLLARALERRSLIVARQVAIEMEYLGEPVGDAFRADTVVDGRLLIEVKSTERPSPVHAKQLRTYLRVTRLPLGLLMNVGQPIDKDGIQRVVNSHRLQ